MDILAEMMNRYKINPFKPGDIVYFYYDDMIICQKGKIVNFIKVDKDHIYYNINWIEKSLGNEYVTKTTSVLPERVFHNQSLCLAYAERMYDLKNSIDIDKEK